MILQLVDDFPHQTRPSPLFFLCIPAHRLAAQRPHARPVHSASKQGAAGLAVHGSQPSVGGLQHRGHVVHGGVGVGDNSGVLHVFSRGDGSLFAGLPAKQPVGGGRQRKIQTQLQSKSS